MSIHRSLLTGAAAFLLSLSAFAGVIRFDELPPDNTNGGIPAARYAALGVTFSTTDDGSTWAGLAAGDPGSWGLHGTNGSTFSGYNGDSYGGGLSFASDVISVSLDAARSNGSADGNRFTLEAYLDGVLMDSMTVDFGAINEWSNLALTGVFDEIRWFGEGDNFHPFGIDNIRWAVREIGNNPVSEPAGLLLSGLALAGLALTSRRRRQ